MNPIILIPARMKATRLPNKPMADIHGEPMIVHVWRRAVESGAGAVAVATDHPQIQSVIAKAGGTAVITREDHPSGSDRVFEALQAIDPEGHHDVVVNLQGDMPTLEPRLVREVLRPFTNPEVDITTLACEIDNEKDRGDPAVVKVVIGQDGRALYFSRTAIPAGAGPLYHHIGIYAYRRAALQKFVGLPPSPLEMREKLEQLRALENGLRIDVAVVDTIPLGVDTQEHLERARTLLRKK